MPHGVKEVLLIVLIWKKGERTLLKQFQAFKKSVLSLCLPLYHSEFLVRKVRKKGGKVWNSKYNPRVLLSKRPTWLNCKYFIIYNLKKKLHRSCNPCILKTWMDKENRPRYKWPSIGSWDDKFDPWLKTF